jgi:A/G-specific adenine glycosylase
MLRRRNGAAARAERCEGGRRVGDAGPACDAPGVRRTDYEQLAAALIGWYARERRVLPWRAAPGALGDPYGVWVSEVMLQQVRVAVVAPRYAPFLVRFPDAAALAAAPVEEVLRHWNGLGRYGRALNLRAAARLLVERHGGALPREEAALRALPGVGPYTAAAIRAMAFGEGSPPPLDPNVERVVARLFRVEAPLPGGRPVLAAHAAALLRRGPPGDLAQALMDLGATVCRPRGAPLCGACPVASRCRATAAGDAARLPVLPPRPPRAVRHAAAFRALREGDGAVPLRRRPFRGVLAGTLDLPATPFAAAPPRRGAALADAPFAARWRRLAGEVRHAMSGFEARVAVYATRVDGGAAAEGGLWLPPEALEREALAGLARKLLAHRAPRR